MLKTKILHPELLAMLGKCGHKTKILVADANYSFVTNSSKTAKIIYLNFSQDMLSAKDVVHGLAEMINIEAAIMMRSPEEFKNSALEDYKKSIPGDVSIDFEDRQSFYEAAKSDQTLLVIATGESRRFANILLTVGVVV